jgi:hypothetical protein
MDGDLTPVHQQWVSTGPKWNLIGIAIVVNIQNKGAR